VSAITTQERSTYEGVWSSVDAYHNYSPGEAYLPIFLECVGESRGHVLDAGTGSGRGAVALQNAGFRVTCCDVTDAGLIPAARELPFREACLWQHLGGFTPAHGSFDYVYCTDVLEHIPPQFTMLAVWQMLRVARRGVFLSVSTVPDNLGVWVGAQLHQTVRSFTWWKDSLGELGRVVDVRDRLDDASFYVTP
jgi:2-polyprenyl-3-methyl-5-hydroxy-6-metoxy-1,4-benzoquinol methylase